MFCGSQVSFKSAGAEFMSRVLLFLHPVPRIRTGTGRDHILSRVVRSPQCTACGLPLGGHCDCTALAPLC